jgi:hypothetical protein
MASKLNKRLERVIKVHGIEGEVVIALDPDMGISFKIRGTRNSITSDWTNIVNACYTPDNVPSVLHGEPYKFLQAQAAGKSKRKIKKIEKAERQNTIGGQ